MAGHNAKAETVETPMSQEERTIQAAIEIIASRLRRLGEVLASSVAVKQLLTLKLALVEHEVFAVLLLVLMATTGCRVITFSQTSPDGVKTTVRVCQAFTATGSYKVTLAPGKASLEATKSGVDGKALGVAVGAAVKAAMTP